MIHLKWVGQQCYRWAWQTAECPSSNGKATWNFSLRCLLHNFTAEHKAPMPFFSLLFLFLSHLLSAGSKLLRATQACTGPCFRGPCSCIPACLHSLGKGLLHEGMLHGAFLQRAQMGYAGNLRRGEETQTWWADCGKPNISEIARFWLLRANDLQTPSLQKLEKGAFPVTCSYL